MGDEIDAKLDLTADEIQKVKEFGNILKERYNYENVLKSELIRYVVGSKGRIAMAEKRFLNMKKLEREYNLNDIQLHQVRDELKSARYVVCGKDIHGRSVLGVNISQFNVKTMDLSLIIKAAMVYCDALTSDLDVCRNGIVLLFDMQGFKVEHLNSGLEKVFFSAFNDTYPLRIKRFIVVNAPMYIRGVIHILKILLSKKLGNRIVSCKSENGDKKGSLWKEIDISQAPKCVHGKFDTNNDGSYPTNAWSFVCSKISGDLPPMTSENLAKHPYPPNSNAKLPPDLSSSPRNQEREISLSDHKWLKVKDGESQQQQQQQQQGDSNTNENKNTENDDTTITSSGGSGVVVDTTKRNSSSGRLMGMFGKAKDRVTQARNKAKGKGKMKTVVTGVNGDDRNMNDNVSKKKRDKNKLGLDENNNNDPSVRSDAVVIAHKYKNRNENLSGNLSPQSNSLISKSLPMPSETETEERDGDTIPAISAYDLQNVNDNDNDNKLDDVDLNAIENTPMGGSTAVGDAADAAMNAAALDLAAPVNDNTGTGDATGVVGTSENNQDNKESEDNQESQASPAAQDKETDSNMNLSANESVEIVDSVNSVDKSKSDDYVNVESVPKTPDSNDKSGDGNVLTVTESPSADKSKSDDFVNVESVKKDDASPDPQ